MNEPLMEYARWRNNTPSWYATPGDMPYRTAAAFEYLTNTFGRKDLSPADSAHDDAVQRAQAELTDLNNRLTGT